MYRNTETDWQTRRVEFYRQRAERKYVRAFAFGFLFAAGTCIAYFYPLVNH